MTVGTSEITIKTFPQMVVNRTFLPILEEAGMTDFNRVFHFNSGKIVKRISTRSITRIEMPADPQFRVLYLKRHFSARVKISDLFGGWFYHRSFSQGMVEFENICEFRKHGMATVVPVAAGQRRVAPLCYESFLITESFEPYMSLEYLIRKKPWMLEGKDGKNRKGRIVEAIARLAKQMHMAGFNHRDFNATHVLISPEDDLGNFSLALFDLQRIDRKKWMRFHWMIKTLAELNYSMPPPHFLQEDLCRLYRIYADKKNTSFVDPLLLFLILRKSNKIRKHTKKIMKYRNSAG